MTAVTQWGAGASERYIPGTKRILSSGHEQGRRLHPFGRETICQGMLYGRVGVFMIHVGHVGDSAAAHDW